MAALGAGVPARATWAVVVADTETGEIGIGQATCVANIDLRALSAVIVTERGVATVQAFVDSSGVSRSTIRDELLAGTPPQQILSELAAVDPNFETHQYCIVDREHAPATYVGTSAQGFAFVGGQTGEAGGLRYCVAGNLLTGSPVVAEAVDALVETEGSLAERLLAAMEAARAMGGDGRCSCSQGNPTGCGSPPASFTRTAINGYVVVARSGDTSSCAQCSGGSYYLDLNVAGQGAGGTDPVPQLDGLYQDFRAQTVGRPDAVRSLASLDPELIPADRGATSQLTVELLDLDGAAAAGVLDAFGVSQTADSDGASSVGFPMNQGGGRWAVTLTGGATPGVDRFRVTADDGVRPVILMPPPRLRVGIPGDVANVRWDDASTLVWDAALAAVSYHVYRGELAQVGCELPGVCVDALDPDPTDLAFFDSETPAAGLGRFYLVSAVDDQASEGGLGRSSCGPRAVSEPCP